MHTELSCSIVTKHHHDTNAANVVKETRADAFSTAKTLLKLPSLWSKGDCFYCDGKELAFNRASRRIALLKAFLAVHNHQLTRQQIITVVYGESQLHRRSPRYSECLNMNVLRTISDTRRQLYLAYTSLYPSLDWLYFNKGEKKWKLVRFRDDYVLSHLNVRIFYPPPQGDPSMQHSGWH